MNKKGDVEISKLIVIILAVIALLTVGIFFWTQFGKGKQSIDVIQDSVKPDSGLFNFKSFALKEKEKCTAFTNFNDCLGIKKEKTGCFWGNINSQPGCYTCTNKDYFKKEFGTCTAYINVFTSEGHILLDDHNFIQGFELSSQNTIPMNNDKITCSYDPCGFSTTKCSFRYDSEHETIKNERVGAIYCS